MTPAIPAKTYAKTAGALYLVIAVFSAFSVGYVPSVIVAAGDAATTAANLLTHQGLVGLGVSADVVVMFTEIALTVMLFILFRPVSPTLSLIAMVSRLMVIGVMAVNLLINILPLLLLSGADHRTGLAPGQLQATALVLVEAHQYGVYVWDMFFGFHLFVLGYLVFRSGHFPRLLGVAMMVGSVGYFFQGLIKVTFLDSAALAMIVVGLLVVATIGELTFAFWLLITGPDIRGDRELTAPTVT